ncbi:unnamed protein product, partial [Discosporangium mesarthrocarpum]
PRDRDGGGGRGRERGKGGARKQPPKLRRGIVRHVDPTVLLPPSFWEVLGVDICNNTSVDKYSLQLPAVRPTRLFLVDQPTALRFQRTPR